MPDDADRNRARLSYPDVGATAHSALPAGYTHVRRTAMLGRGGDCFAAAAEGLMTWQVQRRSGLHVRGADRVALGDDVWMGLGLEPARVGFRCRVISVTDEPRRQGFAYGTLPGHPETGEESFVLTWRDDDRVELEIVAFSRPAQWWSRLAGPVGGLVQRWMTGRYLRALSSRG